MAIDVKTATVRWVAGMEFDGLTGSGHHQTLDAAAAGNASQGPSPMELLLVAMAGCTGMDVIDILRKKREQVTGLSVRVEGSRAESHPRVYTELQVTYIVTGTNVSPQAVEDAIRLSESKYCSVGAMMGKSATIRSHYEIVAA